MTRVVRSFACTPTSCHDGSSGCSWNTFQIWKLCVVVEVVGYVYDLLKKREVFCSWLEELFYAVKQYESL